MNIDRDREPLAAEEGELRGVKGERTLILFWIEKNSFKETASILFFFSASSPSPSASLLSRKP